MWLVVMTLLVVLVVLLAEKAERSLAASQY